VIGPSKIPLPDNIQYAQGADFLAPGGIQTHILSRRAAADLHLKQRGHWDRHEKVITLNQYLRSF